MTGETEIKKAFNDLRPLCVGLTKNADKASILSLHSQLKSTPCMVIQALHEYFLFPLRIVLLKHKETKEDVIIAAINCMTYIFENIKLTEFKVFYDTLKLLIVCITSASNDLLEASGSEGLYCKTNFYVDSMHMAQKINKKTDFSGSEFLRL